MPHNKLLAPEKKTNRPVDRHVRRCVISRLICLQSARLQEQRSSKENGHERCERPERCNCYCNKQGRHIGANHGADGKRVQAEISIELAEKLKGQIEAALVTARIRANRR